MGISKSSAVWNGGFKTGTGEMKPEHSAAVPFSAGTRFEGQQGSNPEEMIGAALAGCFSMALSVGLEQGGLQPQKIQTSANVTLEKVPTGFAITGIALTCRASLGVNDAAKFKTIAEETKKGCPVSKALSAVPITLDAALSERHDTLSSQPSEA